MEEEIITEIEVTEENIEELKNIYGEIPTDIPEKPQYESEVE